METINEVLRAALEAAREREGYSGTLDDYRTDLAGRDWDVRDPTIEAMLSDIKSTSYEPLRLWHAHHHGVKDTIRAKWSEPLRLLDLLIVLAEQFGRDFYKERIAVLADDGERLLLTVLTELHARACQTSSAIHLLLRSGYPDDADARWRTLHETSVIARFIKEGGAALAERYREHGTIQRYKQILADTEQTRMLAEEPEQSEYLRRLELKRDDLIERYGSPFKNDYGWAAEAIGKDNPNLRDIERQVKINEHLSLELWRSHFRSASENVHASSHGTEYRLGLGKHSSKNILTGPSVVGLGDPGFATANSLCDSALALLGTRSNADDVLRSMILTNLAERTSNAFLTTLDDE